MRLQKIEKNLEDVVNFICKLPVYTLLKHPGIYAKDLHSKVGVQTRCWTLDGPKTHQVRSLPDLPIELEQYARSYHEEPLYLIEIQNVTLTGFMPIGIYGRYPLIETFQGEPERFYTHLHNQMELGQCPWTVIDYLLTIIRKDTNNQFDEVFPLVCVNSYAHWLLEYLPRLRAYEAYTELTGNTPIILTVPNTPKWMKQQLDFLGYGTHCSEWTGRRAHAKRLITSTHRLNNRNNFHPGLSDWNWLKERAVERASLSNNYSQYVYISREGEKERTVSNEETVMSELSSLGFERYNPVEMSFAEQVNLFANAEIVVGPHGGGLANIIFGNDSLSLIELFPDNDIRPQFYRLAEICGLKYSFLLEQTVSDSDLFVDVDRLSVKIQNIKSDIE